MRKLHPLTILLATGLATAGCGGSTKSAAPPVTATPTTTVVPTTLPPQTTTTSLPNTTGTDLINVMRSLDQLLSMAYERADLGLLALIFTPDAEPRATAEKQLRYLVENGWHYDPQPSSIKDITVKTPLDGVAVIDLVSSLDSQVVKDASGQVTKTGEGWTPRRERYGLFRGGDGRWRIRDFSVLGPA